MRSDMEKAKTSALEWLVFWLLFLVVFVAWGLLLLIPSPPLGRGAALHRGRADAGPVVPDLSGCTRLETWYIPSTYEVFTDSGRQASLMNAAELEQLRSHEKGVLEGAERIAGLAARIPGLHPEDIADDAGSHVPGMARVVCYEGSRRVASVVVNARGYRPAREGRRLDYGDTRLIALDLAPDLKPLALRIRCASLLESLLEVAREYPPPDSWSDAVTERPTEVFARLTSVCGEPLARHLLASRLRCPSAGEGRCNYAMNPNCGPDSPGDVVLLFETKAGWNQHGGPELFTFDNHDPKGGCVLLNDGSVKFIRTEEDLHALRWKWRHCA